MKFESYILNEENRSKPIDTKEAINLIDDHCINALSLFQTTKNGMFRGLLRETHSEVLTVNPSEFTRVSRNEINLYTLIIDNSPAWKEYPKRSKSIVCSTEADHAAEYGNGQAFLVLPYDGSKIGICPTSDIWDCTIAQFGIGLPYINFTVDDMLITVGVGGIRKDVEWAPLKAKFDMFEKNFKKASDLIRAMVMEKWKTRLEIDYDTKKTLLENLQKTIDPKILGFKVVKAGAHLASYRETWTDGKCILIDTKSQLYWDMKG